MIYKYQAHHQKSNIYWDFVNGLRSSPRMVQIHFLMRFSDAASNFRLDMCLLKKFFTPKIFLWDFQEEGLRGVPGDTWDPHIGFFVLKNPLKLGFLTIFGVFRPFRRQETSGAMRPKFLDAGKVKKLQKWSKILILRDF